MVFPEESATLDRGQFLRLLASKSIFLEIGVFDNPSIEFLRESETLVHYADWLSKDELIQRAKCIEGRNHSQVPDIKWVLSDGYNNIDIKYDAVISHHCVEHQPDLVRHFIDIKSITKTDGWYLFSLPDKRYCFDHYLPESNILDVLEAFLLERKSPSFKSVLEHRCFTSHTFQTGINPFMCSDPAMVDRFNSALEEYKASNYVDVHCWAFTPDSFRTLFNQIIDLKLLPGYQDFKVYPGIGEFYVALAF